MYRLLGVLFMCTMLQAQDVTVLDLDQAIDIALESSYEMKSLRLNLMRSEQNLIAAKGRFKTNVEASMQVPNWQENVSEIPVPGELPVFNTTGSLRYQGMLDIIQPTPIDGRLTLRSMAYHRDVSTYRASLEQETTRKDMYGSISLRYHQPLFTINRLKLGLQTANLSYERTEQRYRRSQLDVVYLVTQTFFETYRAKRQKEIAEQNLRQQQELFDLATKKYQAGLIPEVEALQMEVDLAEAKNELLAAEGRLARSQDAFKQQIGLALSDNIDVTTDISFDRVEVDLNRALELALQNRTEIREAKIDLELAQIDVKEADAQSEIRGDLNLFYDLTGVSDPTLPGSASVNTLWSSMTDDMQRRPNNRGVVFTLSVPIWDWGVNAAQVQAARASLQNSELDLEEQKKTIRRQVRDVVASLRETENRLQVLDKNQQVAQRAFQISVERFNNGDITSQELALDRNRYTQAQTSFLDAYIAYRLALADLKRKTMWDFEIDRSVVE